MRNQGGGSDTLRQQAVRAVTNSRTIYLLMWTVSLRLLQQSVMLVEQAVVTVELWLAEVPGLSQRQLSPSRQRVAQAELSASGQTGKPQHVLKAPKATRSPADQHFSPLQIELSLQLKVAQSKVQRL